MSPIRYHKGCQLISFSKRIPQSSMFQTTSQIPFHVSLLQKNSDVDMDRISPNQSTCVSPTFDMGPDFSPTFVVGSHNNHYYMTNRHSTHIPPTLNVDDVFDSKEDMNHFTFLVKKSTHLWYVKCKDPNCRWRLRSLKLNESSLFRIRKYDQLHVCGMDVQQSDQRQPTGWTLNYRQNHKT